LSFKSVNKLCEKKKKMANNKLELLRKYWALFFGITMAVLAVISFIYSRGVEDQDNKNLKFDSVTQKHDVLDHITDSPTPEQKQRAIILDSINKTSAIEHRKAQDQSNKLRDSIAISQDSINRLNSDQLYQIKELLRNRDSL